MMKKKKTLVAGFLSLSLLGLTACGNNTSSSQPSNSSAGNDTKSLRVIMIADPWVDVMKKFGDEYEKKTGIKVQVDSYSYDQTHQKEVLLGTQKSDAADVIVMDSPWIGEFAEGQIVEDLKSRIEQTPDLKWDDYIPSFEKVAEWKDKIVGVPFAPYYVMLHYRKDLFQKEGINPPKTYDELLSIAKKFTNNPKYPGMYGIAMNNAKGAPVGQAWFEYIFNFGGKPFESNYPGSKDPYSDMTPKFDSEQSIQVVKLFKDLLQYEPPGALNMAWDERTQAFAQGKVAMMAEWSVRTPGLLDPSRSQVADKFDTAVVPSLTGKDPVPPLGGWLMGINKYSKKKDAAWDFIKWVNGQDIHKQFVLQGGPPARISELKDPELNKKFPWFGTLAESAEKAYADCRPRIPESFQVIDTIGNYVSQTLSGQMPIEQAMKQANNEISNLLKQSGYTVK
jgi:multiple sugar transport system substrate-binding protein